MERKSVKSYNFPIEYPPTKADSVNSVNNVNNIEASGATPANSTTDLVDRGNWSNPVEFVLACMNYALGLGNVWRFPYLAFRNGGGAFLLPYGLMVFIIGLPIFFAELVIGQYSGLGPIKAFRFMAPFFKGLGYCCVLTTLFVTIYYMVIVAWVIFYLWTSFFPSLIWGDCEQDWNSMNCYNMAADLECQKDNTGTPSDQIYFRRQCRLVDDICRGNVIPVQEGLVGLNAQFCMNTASNVPVPINQVITRVLAAEEFFYENVLGIGTATWNNDWGWPQGHLVLCLFIAWALAFICVFRGVKSVGKIVYFTATFPYLVLTALLVRALTLDGAIDGIWFFINPQWESLESPGVWGDAASQVFFSFSLAWGALIVLASYNKFNNNCHFDAVTVSMINFGTAIFNGIVVFAILGFLSHSMNVPIDEVTSTGPGLTFITYPEAVLLMPLPQLWAILFFFMMLVLGLGSMFGSVQMLQSSIIDQWPHLRDHEWRVTAGICLGCFIAALPMTCNGGIYLQTLIEWHTASWNIFLIGLAQIIVFAWVYGINKVLANIREMGMKLWLVLRIYWRAVWLVLTPALLVAIFAFIMTDISATQFRGLVFPVWAEGIGWMFGAMTLLPFVVFATIQLVRVCRGKATLRELFTPTEQWGPQEIDGRKVDRAQM